METKNWPLIESVYKEIKHNPETWNQGVWHCGTSACFAGWAAQFTGAKWFPGSDQDVISPVTSERTYVSDYAQKELGLTYAEKRRLFSGGNTLQDITDTINGWRREEGLDDLG